MRWREGGYFGTVVGLGLQIIHAGIIIIIFFSVAIGNHGLGIKQLFDGVLQRSQRLVLPALMVIWDHMINHLFKFRGQAKSHGELELCFRIIVQIVPV